MWVVGYYIVRIIRNPVKIYIYIWSHFSCAHDNYSILVSIYLSVYLSMWVVGYYIVGIIRNPVKIYIYIWSHFSCAHDNYSILVSIYLSVCLSMWVVGYYIVGIIRNPVKIYIYIWSLAQRSHFSCAHDNYSILVSIYLSVCLSMWVVGYYIVGIIRNPVKIYIFDHIFSWVDAYNSVLASIYLSIWPSGL